MVKWPLVEGNKTTPTLLWRIFLGVLFLWSKEGWSCLLPLFFLSPLFLSMTFHVFVFFFLSSLFLLFDFTLFWGLLLLSQGGRHSSYPNFFFLSPSFPLLPLPSPLSFFYNYFTPTYWWRTRGEHGSLSLYCGNKRGACLLEFVSVISSMFFNFIRMLGAWCK